LKGGDEAALVQAAQRLQQESYDPTRNPTCDEGCCDYELRADYVKSRERGSGLAGVAAKR
jgi:hypothetical protein